MTGRGTERARVVRTYPGEPTATTCDRSAPPLGRSSLRAAIAVALTSLFVVGLLLPAGVVPSGTSGAQPAPRSTPGPSVGVPASSFPTPIQHVFVVVLENAARSTVEQKGPYMVSLAQRYAQATEYYAICHPSAPNYLAMTGGVGHQCGSDAWNVYNTTSIADLLESGGRTWAAYDESMPTACDTTDAYPYAVKHNPFVYYADIVDNASRCAAHDGNFTAWSTALASGQVPNFALFTPNLTDDGHDTSVGTADTWLHGWLSPLLNESFFASSVFFVTYDESVNDNTGYNGTMGGHVFFAAVSPYAKTGYNLTANASHYSLLSTVEWLLGVGNTGQHDGTSSFPPLRDLFAFPTEYTVGGVVRAADTLAPIAGARVGLSGVGNATTGATGTFSFAATNGSYRLTVAADGFLPNTTPLQVAGAPVELNVTLARAPTPTYAITGTVTDRATGEWITGALVSLNATVSNRSNRTGAYDLAAPNGTYTLDASAPGFAAAEAVVTVAGAPAGVDFALDRLPSAVYSLSGRVTAASSGVPIEGAEVTTSSGDLAVTNASGGFLLAIPNGSYRVTAAAAGFVPQNASVDVAGSDRTLDFALVTLSNGSGENSTPLSLNLTAAPTDPSVGESSHLTAAVSGGTPPYETRWDFGDGTNASGGAVAHAYAQPGRYQVTVVVTDAGGQVARASTVISVDAPESPAPPPPSSAAGPSAGAFSPIAAALLAAAAIALGIADVGLVRSLRRSRARASRATARSPGSTRG